MRVSRSYSPVSDPSIEPSVRQTSTVYPPWATTRVGRRGSTSAPVGPVGGAPSKARRAWADLAVMTMCAPCAGEGCSAATASAWRLAAALQAAAARPLGERRLLVGVRLGRIDRGRQIGGRGPTRLLALRPVELLLDGVLAEAQPEEGLLG